MRSHELTVAQFSNAADRSAISATDDYLGFWACEAQFRTVATRPFAESAINVLLRAAHDGVSDAGRFLDGRVVLAAGSNGAWRLSLVLIERQTRFISSAVRHAMICPIVGAPLPGDLYRLPAGFDGSIFDPGAVIQFDRRIECPVGQIIQSSADRVIFDPAPTAPTLLLVFETAPVAALEWQFSRSTRRAWSSREGDPAVAGLKLAAWIAGQVAHPELEAPLKALVAHPDAGTRLAALQQLEHFHAHDEREWLSAALQDSHEQIRRTARRRLGHLEKPRGRDLSCR